MSERVVRNMPKRRCNETKNNVAYGSRMLSWLLRLVFVVALGQVGLNESFVHANMQRGPCAGAFEGEPCRHRSAVRVLVGVCVRPPDENELVCRALDRSATANLEGMKWLRAFDATRLPSKPCTLSALTDAIERVAG